MNLAESTLITMADGSLKPLKEIEIGEWITSFDFETEMLTTNPILCKEEFTPQHSIELELENGTRIQCGPNHAFYIKNPKDLDETILVKAHELSIGHVIIPQPEEISCDYTYPD